MLQYDRMKNDVSKIFTKDAASCMACHSKFIALGTHWGWIYILDHQGNDIRGKEVPAHTTTVNQLSIDSTGDYMASCSDDGKVVITGIYNDEHNTSLTFERPIKAVSLEPNFSKQGSSKSFITGTEKIILTERGFFRNKSTTIYEGRGPVRTFKWHKTFIAWADDVGVKVYDTTSRSRIANIGKDHEYRPDLYCCNLRWIEDRVLLIGWANKVTVCVVKDKEFTGTRYDTDVRNLPNRYVQLLSNFENDYFVCGISRFGENFVILAYEDEKQEGSKLSAVRPRLQIVSVDEGMSYSQLSCDQLSIRAFQDCRCIDYHLECVAEENIFYIVSPKDIIVATPCDADYLVSWLLQRERYEEAMKHVSEHRDELKKHTLIDVGRQCVSSLLQCGKYDDAARFCVQMLGKDKKLWEEEVFKFAELNQLRAIAPYLPRNEPKLSPMVYEMILNEYLQTDHKAFMKLLKDWPSDLYNIQTLVNAVLDKLDLMPNDKTLLYCLAELYTSERRFDKTLEIFLRLQHRDIFTLIYKYNLYDTISNKIKDLLFDKEQAFNLLIENVDRIPVDTVVQQLKSKPEILQQYLHNLFIRDPHIRHDHFVLQLTLYAEYDQANLIHFLRSSSIYPLSAALKMCEERDLTEERVYLLGRMGQTKQALELIMNRLKNVERAIDFCKEHNDVDLWHDLIDYSLDKPSFITHLLHNIGTHVDPIIIIDRIRPSLEIPGLRDALVKIMQDYNLQISLREGCRRILIADSFNLLSKQIKLLRRGVSISHDQVCCHCEQPLISLDMQYISGEVVVFFCRHTFHEDCLSELDTMTCAICKTQKRRSGSGRLGVKQK